MRAIQHRKKIVTNGKKKKNIFFERDSGDMTKAKISN